MTVLIFLGNLFVFCMPAALLSFASVRLMKTSRDEWKVLAWVPVVPLALWGAIMARDVTKDQTAHSLWPFELVYWGGLSLVLLSGVIIARRMFGGRRTDRPSRDG